LKHLLNYYSLWDADEFFDLETDPTESKNLIFDPAHRKTVREMENRLYQMMGELGGMEIPLSQPLRRAFPNTQYRPPRQ
jgi:N-acetylglucosamine-6-sulfatase